MKKFEEMSELEKLGAVLKYTFDACLVLTALFLASCLIALECGAEEETSSPSASWRGYERTTIGYDAETDTFTNIGLKGEAESAAMKLTAEAADEMAAAAQTEMARLNAKANEIISAEAGRPVIHLTADLDLDDALDRENLCMCVPKWDYEPATRKVTAKVFTNKLLASPPIVEAHFRSAMSGKVEKVKCAWDGYGTKADEVTLTHQNSYTNFVIVSRPYEAEQVMVTNVTFEVTAWEKQVVTNYLHEFSSKSYLKDKMVAFYDAKENAGYLTHNNDNSRWESLVGNDVWIGSVGGIEALDDCYSFGGGYLQLNTDNVSKYSGKSYIIVYSYYADTASQHAFFDFDYGNNYPCYGKVDSGVGSFHGTSIGMQAIYLLDEAISVYSQFNPFTQVVNGVNPVGGQVAASWGNRGNNRATIGCRATLGEFSSVKIHSLRFYDTNLTPEEIARETAIDNERYKGVPADPKYDIYRDTTTTTTTTTNWVEKTYTYTETLTLTNSVILTVDGAQPKITLKGDRETFECYDLVFTLPEGYDEKSLDFIQWGRIGDPQTGFNFGNRQMRVNGEMTLTTAPTDPVPSILSLGSVYAYDDEIGEWVEITEFDFFTDNGHTKAIKKEEE